MDNSEWYKSFVPFAVIHIFRFVTKPQQNTITRTEHTLIGARCYQYKTFTTLCENHFDAHNATVSSNNVYPCTVVQADQALIYNM